MHQPPNNSGDRDLLRFCQLLELRDELALEAHSEALHGFHDATPHFTPQVRCGLSFISMLCKGCQNDLGDYTRRRAFLCIMTMGDESILSWWLCDACGLYTQEEYVDRFMGDSYANVSGPFPKEVGDADVARVATCPARNDKWCECETHKHFGSD